MNITCEKCGGNNNFPKRKTTMFCDFCGTSIEAPKKETKTKVVNSTTRVGSDKEIILEYIRNGSKGKFELPMADLKGIHLKNANLEGANLEGANLEGANLKGTVLKGANLKNACLIGADLTDTDLSHADMTNIETYGGSEENGVKFCGANLTGAVLKNCDLRNCDFRNANLKDVDLSGADLTCATVNIIKKEQLQSAANIDILYIHNADLQGFDFRNIGNCRKLYLMNVNIKGADFSNSKIKEISIENSNLSDVNFSGCTLKLDAKHSDLSNIDFSKANSVIFISSTYRRLKNVKFHNSDLRGAQFKGGYSFESCFIDDIDFRGADLRKMNFENIFFKNVDFSGADLSGAIFGEFKNFETTNFKGAKLTEERKERNCYLTTACVEVINLPDDCHELETLRKFRDGFVSETDDGKELIRQYYEIAPKIINTIKQTGNGIEIFRNLYDEISEIVLLIDNLKYKEAFQYYCDMTLNLKAKYLN